MSLPGLKSSVELEPGPSSPQLVDRATGQRLPISEMEAKVLGVWDGAETATALSAKCFVEGVNIEPAQVEQFFQRLAKANVLGKSAPVVPDAPPQGPGVEEPTDLVPRLRGDLLITKSTTSKGTLEVKDPTSGRSFTLYDFEVSIARMLDGKRSAQEVLDAANKLGIPVTLPTLKTFLKQLRSYQFIDLTADAGGDTTWPRRKQWPEGVRELYQSALRLMRGGKFDEALGYAEAMIAADPGNEDAVALKQRIMDEALGSNEVSVPFDTLHTPVTSSAIQNAPAPDPFADFGFNSAPPTVSQLTPMPENLAPPQAPVLDVPPPSEAPQPSPMELLAPPSVPPVTRDPLEPPAAAPVAAPAVAAPQRGRKGLFIGLGAVLVVLVVLLRPVDGMAQLPCELQVDELGVPKATFAGPVTPPMVKPGARVEKGAVLAKLAVPPEESSEGLDARIKELEAKLAASRPPGTPKQLAKVKADIKKFTSSIASLKKIKRQSKKATEKQLAVLDEKLANKEAELEKAKAELEELKKPDHRDAWKKELQELTSKKVVADVQKERAVIVAPAAGLFLAPETAPQQLTENEAYGRIVDTTFRAVTQEPLVTSADTAVFVAPTGRVDVKLFRSPAGVTARVEGNPKWVGTKGTLEVASGKTPWLLSALR